MLTLAVVGKHLKRLVERARAARAAWKDAGEGGNVTLESLAEQVQTLHAKLQQAGWPGLTADDGQTAPAPHPGALKVKAHDTIHDGRAGRDWEPRAEGGGVAGGGGGDEGLGGRRAVEGAASGGVGGEGCEAESGKSGKRRKRGRGPDKRPRKPGTGEWQSRHLAELPTVKRRVEHFAANPAVLPEIEHPKKRLYVLAFAETGNRTQAAEIAGVGRTTPYSRDWREDLVFQAALRQAKEAAADLIEQETGWYQGKPGAMVREYSDLLTIFLLKGLRPEKYQERVQMRGALANLDMNLLPDEAIDRIANGEHVMSVLASMVPRAGEAVPGLLAPSEERE